MVDCPQDVINRMWRLFAAQGIGDDFQIIETLAYHLLRRSGHTDRANRSTHPQPIALSDTRADALQALLTEALGNQSAADLLNCCLLFKPDTMQAGGRYPTPRHITRLMADLARVFIADDHAAVADFACGSGGLLVEFGEHKVTGIEISPTWGRIARANLLLNGMPAAEIHTGDALTILGTRVTDQFNIITMNPSFGSTLEAERVEQRLGEGKGTRSETVLALLALNYLQPDGVLAVLQPGGALFSTSSGEATLRNRLLIENRLEAIIQLPKDAFQPYSQVQTYLLLARNSAQSSIVADAPVWFYQVTHDGFSSGRNRQPQPEQSQLPQLVAAVAAGQVERAWEIRDDTEVVQLEIRPLTTGGYRIVQPDSGKLSVHALTTPGATVLWLTRQAENTHHILLYETALWRQQPLPAVRSDVGLTPLAFQLADESGQAVTLEQPNGGWQLMLKSSQTVTPGKSITPGGGYLALFAAATGELLSPLLLLEDVHKDYRPRSLVTLPLENDNGEPAGSLLLWDSSTVNPLFFASEPGDTGWFIVAGDEEAVLVGWENSTIKSAMPAQLKRTFAGEPWHRGVVVDANGLRFGVAVAPTYIRDDRKLDLTFDHYYPPDEREPALQRSAAEILATMREKQQKLAGHLNYLLGIIEMRSTTALPPPVVEVTPLEPLNSSQRLVWQRIVAMTEVANGVTAARPFRSEDLTAGLNQAEVQQTLALFERMGLIVPVVIDGAPYYRRLTEWDIVTA